MRRHRKRNPDPADLAIWAIGAACVGAGAVAAYKATRPTAPVVTIVKGLMAQNAAVARGPAIG